MPNNKAELSLEQLRLVEGLRDGFVGEPIVHSDDCAYFAASIDNEDAPCNCGVASDYAFVDAAIAEAKRVDRMHGWVPVSERMPDAAAGTILVCRSGCPWLTRLHTVMIMVPLPEGITHWRKLPPLPEVPE